MDVLTRTLNAAVLSEQHATKRFEVECSILRYLKHGDRTVAQLSLYLDYEDRATRRHLARLAYEKKIHICGWQEVPNFFKQYRPVIRGGPGEHAPYPRENAPMNALVKEMVQFAALAEGADDYEFKRPPTVVNVRRDELVEALFGKAKQHGRSNKRSTKSNV